MKNLVRVIMVFAPFAVWCTTAFGQEELLPLRYNTEIFNHQKPASIRSAVDLPFLDDFSYPGPDPDPSLWENNGALLNLTFPVDPITYGVVSFDGLNSQGIPYNPTSFSFTSIGSADTLASVPVLLEALTAADSVYFSFFYQAGGLGDYPNTQSFNLSNYSKNFGDSLVLEFKDTAGTWIHAWAHDGETVQPFKQVLIPVTNAKFLHDDFQFRFRNFASLIGNYDQWHIDYVRLNKGRNKFDTLISDVAVQRYPSSILKTYQAMPWKQFQNYQDMEKADHHFLAIKNNFNEVKNTPYNFSVKEKVSGMEFFVSNVQSQNIGAHETAYVALNAFEIPEFSGDSVIISTEYIIAPTGGINIPTNDKIVRDQLFYNYMAYDDGSAEATYRLLGSPAAIAQEYFVNEPDTLQAIGIHFSNTDENMSQNLFSLMVWSSLDPEVTLYVDDFLKPKYAEELNGFILYRLSEPIIVTGKFYIGFLQTSVNSDIKTDIGFDLNTDGSDFLSYNINDEWNLSGFKGSLMMRPYLGKTIPFQVGIDAPATISDAGIAIYPNPVSDILNVQCENAGNYQFEVLDNTGRALQKVIGQKSVSVAKLAAGFYLLRATHLRTGKTSIHKFIKQ